tara:strand:- start:585 stop:809 length:225 start_codon:yes stop_codon:yes gene_type:complete
MKIKEILMVSIVALAFMLITGVAKANVMTWVIEQKDKTVEYQKESWKQSKLQFFRTKQQLLDLFDNEESNESQD